MNKLTLIAFSFIIAQNLSFATTIDDHAAATPSPTPKAKLSDRVDEEFETAVKIPREKASSKCSEAASSLFEDLVGYSDYAKEVSIDKEKRTKLVTLEGYEFLSKFASVTSYSVEIAIPTGRELMGRVVVQKGPKEISAEDLPALIPFLCEGEKTFESKVNGRTVIATINSTSSAFVQSIKDQIKILESAAANKANPKGEKVPGVMKSDLQETLAKIEKLQIALKR